MTSRIGASSSSFYDLLPPAEHRTGDIWKDVPCGGLFRSPVCDGLLVTPACDLANSKSDSLTFLPIMSAKRVLVSPLFHRKHRAAFLRSLSIVIAALEESALPTEPGFDDLLSAASAALLQAALLPDRKQKQIDIHLVRVREGRDLVSRSMQWASRDRLFEIKPSVFESLYGPDWTRMSQALVTNAGPSDLHFLPSDSQDESISAVSRHSFVLLRYPFTVHASTLEPSVVRTTETWSATVESLSGQIPIECSRTVPLKSSTLKQAYLVDVLSRHQSLFGRAGSPDFTPRTIESFAKEICG